MCEYSASLARPGGLRPATNRAHLGERPAYDSTARRRYVFLGNDARRRARVAHRGRDGSHGLSSPSHLLHQRVPVIGARVAFSRATGWFLSAAPYLGYSRTSLSRKERKKGTSAFVAFVGSWRVDDVTRVPTGKQSRRKCESHRVARARTHARTHLHLFNDHVHTRQWPDDQRANARFRDRPRVTISRRRDSPLRL